MHYLSKIWEKRFGELQFRSDQDLLMADNMSISRTREVKILVVASNNMAVDNCCEAIHRLGVRVLRVESTSKQEEPSRLPHLCLHNMVYQKLGLVRRGQSLTKSEFDGVSAVAPCSKGLVC